MTNLEKAVALIANDCREEAAEVECETMQEYFKVMWIDKEEALAWFVDVLRDAEAEGLFTAFFTDDCEIEHENDGGFYSFKELLKAVRKVRF